MDITPAVVELLDASHRKTTVVAVVGASNDRFKYGNIISRVLLQKGFTVRPINPSADQVLGLPAHPTLAAARAAGPIHIADFVVPPEVSLEIVRELDGSECDVLWFQPGSFDARVVELARSKGKTVVAGPCIMVEAE